MVNAMPRVKTNMKISIPLGLAIVAGELRSSRTGVGIHGTSPQQPRTYLVPFRKVVESSGRYVDSLRIHRRRGQRASA